MEKKVASKRKAVNKLFAGMPKKVKEQFSDLPSRTLLDDAFLEQERVSDKALRDAVIRCVQEHLQAEKFAVLHPPKLINDPIHGTISLHPLAVLIMNTPQFQRLHYIKQLSLKHYVYPSAGYSRFEHSVGVYHLAGKLVNILKNNQPKLRITAIDAMCVQLAGLCHDLGHGPFSHLFDGTIIPDLKSKFKDDRKWKHEDASTKLLDVIYEQLHSEITAWGICKNDIEFIKSLIKGQENPEETGRDKHKSFLYEIVSNELSGTDVDKWDYLVRDSYHLGLKCGFDPDRLMYHMRVMEIAGGDGKEHICVRRKEHDSVYSMFHTRYELYRKALQHPVVIGVEMMVAAAIVGADEYLRIDGKKGKPKTLLECIDDMVAYTNLHDGILFKILESTDKALETSKYRTRSEAPNRPEYLLERVQKRDLWKCVGQAVILPSEGGDQPDEKSRCKKIAKDIEKELSSFASLPHGSFKCKVNIRNFGKKDKNPLEEIGFYDKEDPNKAYLITDKDARSAILPKEFQQSILFIYCTSEREKLKKKAADVRKAVKTIFKTSKYGLKVLSS